jgi:hypothetical protein
LDPEKRFPDGHKKKIDRNQASTVSEIGRAIFATGTEQFKHNR